LANKRTVLVAYFALFEFYVSSSLTKKVDIMKLTISDFLDEGIIINFIITIPEKIDEQFPNRIIAKTLTVKSWAHRMYVTPSIYYPYINLLLQYGFLKAFKDGKSNSLFMEVVLPFPNPPNQGDDDELRDETKEFLKKLKTKSD
jgi:hypothetical protein